uniref:Peptidase A1 domain-containing protein n=1 Tax=Cucumis melo TaxID=3656 RepID=A0A1S4DT41_CUCME
MASTFSSGAQMLLLLSVFILAGSLRSGDAASFKFNIHHRFSDSVKEVLHSEGLPEKHTPGYYATMVHRDRLVRGRRLAATNDDTQLTFAYGNDTVFIAELGFLYYANVSVGTPSVDFLVALDTGSDLFWLPCECSSCATYLNTSNGGKFMLNHYSPNDSTTSSIVPCTSSLCGQCTSNKNTCPYEINYVSANTSSIGYLVEDVLHLAADDALLKPVEAKITFGCGTVQTGIFATTAAPNGLIGLGMEKISVPSFLADQGLTSDSFSMCFGLDGYGRIDFGDTGPAGQKQTPFNTMLHQSYNVTFNEINVGGKTNNVPFTAIFDSGTSFTYLTEPTYSTISEQMDAGMKLKRFSFGPSFPFQYCYEISPSAKEIRRPQLNFTMEGGDEFVPIDIFVVIPVDETKSAACLALAKSTDIDLIGQNFMTGYRIIFNRGEMVLGWSPSDCYDNGDSTPSDSPPADSPPSDSPPTDSPPSDSPPTDDTPPSGDSPPSDDSPPSGDSPPAPSTPGGGNGLPRIGAAARLNPLGSVFVAVLAILAVV